MSALKTSQKKVRRRWEKVESLWNGKKHRSLFRQMTESHHNNKQKFFRISVDIWSGFRRRSSTLKRKKTLIRKKVLQQQLEWRRQDFQSNDIWCGDISQMRDIRVNYFGLKVKKCWATSFLTCLIYFCKNIIDININFAIRRDWNCGSHVMEASTLPTAPQSPPWFCGRLRTHAPHLHQLYTRVQPPHIEPIMILSWSQIFFAWLSIHFFHFKRWEQDSNPQPLDLGTCWSPWLIKVLHV